MLKYFLNMPKATKTANQIKFMNGLYIGAHYFMIVEEAKIVNEQNKQQSQQRTCLKQQRHEGITYPNFF